MFKGSPIDKSTAVTEYMGNKNAKPQVPKGWVAVWDDKYNGMYDNHMDQRPLRGVTNLSGQVIKGDLNCIDTNV